MIIVRFQGGLGNQMFQYAFGRALSLANNTELVLDSSAYGNEESDPEKKDIRAFGLKYYNLSARVANPQELKFWAKYYAPGIWPKFYRKFYRLGPYLKKKFIIEPQSHSFIFDQNVFKYPLTGTVGLSGYWQTEKYFKNISETIRKEFTLKGSFSNTAASAIADIQKCPVPVLVQIRRGDYAKSAELQNRFGLLGTDYFRRGLKFIADKVNQPITVFFVSDDVSWVTERLSEILIPEVNAHSFISRPGLRDYEEMLVMGYCRHSVISNSSYAWWGAWLGTAPDKIVVAPKSWVITPGVGPLDILPQSWHGI